MLALLGHLRTEMNIFLPFHMLKLVPYKRKGRKMHPFFRATYPIGHYREHPLGHPSGWTTVRLQNRKLGPICTQKLLFKQIFCHHQLLTKADGFSRFFKFCLRTDNLQRLRAEICLGVKTGKKSTKYTKMWFSCKSFVVKPLFFPLTITKVVRCNGLFWSKYFQCG